MRSIRSNALLAGTAIAAALFATASPGAVLTPLLQSFGFQGGQGNTVVEDDLFFSVPKFDPALGTLTGVTVAAQHTPINAVLTADSGSSLSFAMIGATATSRARITVNRLQGLTPVELGVSNQSNPLTPDDPPGPTGLFPINTDTGLPDFLDDIVIFRGVIGGDSVTASLSDAVNLSAFTGTSGVTLLHVNLFLSSGLTGPVASLRSLYGDSGGQIRVQYEYDETQSPGPDPTVSAPPSVLLALLAPLLAAGASRRR